MLRIAAGYLAVVAGLLLLACSPSTVQAQSYLTQAGTPAFTTAQPVELGFLNLANGNLHQTIGLGSFPQRGARPFSAALVYDSRIWNIVTIPSAAWQPTNAGSQGGWRFVTSADTGQMSFTSTGDRYGASITSAIWADPLGTAHTFGVSLALESNNNCVSSSSSAFANDATGLYASVTHSCPSGALTWTVYAPDGTVVNSSVSGSHAPEDTNGNYFSTANGNVVDTLGRTPITVTANCNGNSSQTCYAVLNSQGNTSTFTVTTTTVNVNTAFGQSGVTEYSGSFTAIQSIQLPDGTSYTFSYDSGTTAGHYGGLTSITLPTGAQITYAYTKFQDSFGNKNMWATSRVSGGGTWSYTPAVITTCGSGQVGCQQKVTVRKPSTDTTVYTFTLNNGAWKSQIQAYTGASTLLSTASSTWDFSQPCSPTPCTGASNIRVLTTTTTLPTPGGNSITSQTKVAYADTNTPNVASIKSWKFYAGTSPTFPATPDGETDFTYQATFGNNITNRVTQTIVKGSGGNVVAQTNYSYDDTGSLSPSTPATGIQNHDDTNYGIGNTVRGNLTSVKRCTDLANCAANYVQTALTYDTTGQVLSVKDPKNYITSLSYADSFFTDVGDGPSHPPQPYPVNPATNAYPTTVSPPLIPASTLSYYYGTSQMASATDTNGQTSYWHFNDAFSRGTSAVLPNGGWSYASYSPAETQSDTYTGITGAFATSGCTGCRKDEVLLDNLGRLTTQKLLSDPEGTTSVVTNYDTTGRVLNGSHPYRSTNDLTYGLETPTYDGIDRVIKVTHQDTTLSQVSYGAAVSGTGAQLTQLCTPTTTYGLGYPSLYIDEAGKKREVWTDGFGRTIEADEPDSSGALTSNTCYKYDAVGNLLQIIHGTQTRTYTYDALSRPISVKVPEISDASGTQCAVNYTYDNNGNILTRKAPAPNQTSCPTTDPATFVMTTYSYDALNRLTGKTYSDSTPSVIYYYDQTAYNGLTITNGKGRRTGMSDGSGTTAWSYDTAGRVLTEKRTILGVTLTTSYTYNLDGSIATITYPSTNVVAYTVSDAQHLTAAKDVANNIQFATAANYIPPGGLSALVTGQISGGFGGITESHTYNNSLEYTSTKALPPSGPAALDLTLSYNLPGSDNGTVTSITNNVATETGRTQSLTYDPLNRILSAKSSATSGVDCWGQNFGPDGAVADDDAANLTKINNGSQAPPLCTFGSLNATVDSNNHINTDSTYATDAAGNMTKDGSGTGYLYTFDAEGRLTLAAGPSGGPYCYVYDGLGLRVAKKSSATTCSSGTVTKLYWRGVGGDTLAETDSSGSVTNVAYAEYVFFAGRRIASRINSGNGNSLIFYYFADQLGSTRTITTGSGKNGDGSNQTPGLLCYDADFTPYGQEISFSARLQTAACPPNYKFTGYERDSETGLDYAFARYYSSLLGRFLSTDPLGGSVGSLQSNNAYAYVLNDPANLSDPFGLDPHKKRRRHPMYRPRHAIDCVNTQTSMPGSGPGTCGGSDFGNCTIDSAPTSCGVVQSLLLSEAARPCNGNCAHIRWSTKSGTWQEWIPGGQVSWTYGGVTSYGPMIPGHWVDVKEPNGSWWAYSGHPWLPGNQNYRFRGPSGPQGPFSPNSGPQAPEGPINPIEPPPVIDPPPPGGLAPTIEPTPFNQSPSPPDEIFGIRTTYTILKGMMNTFMRLPQIFMVPTGCGGVNLKIASNVPPCA